MKRVKVIFGSREIEFVDREKALKQIEEFAERGTRFPIVVYGPEGCGKTALFKQAKALLEEEYNYYVVYVSPLAREERGILVYTPSIRDIVDEVLKSFPEPYSRIVDVAINIVGRVMKRIKRPRIAVLMDDIFQAIGLDKAEIYIKSLLNLIEYPSEGYEKIVVLVSSSEGITMERIGRHRWANIFIMWNMNKEGFRRLYNVLSESKPQLEEVWRLTGGNPAYLDKLYELSWSAESVVRRIIRERLLYEWIPILDLHSRELLREALVDPDAIFHRLHEEAARKLRDELIARNLVVRVWERDESTWIDVPPSEKDPELGIGMYYAWQTPLHREAVRMTLERFSKS